MIVASFGIAPARGADSNKTIAHAQEQQAYLDRLTSANERFSNGEQREAIKEWEALRKEPLLPSTWGKLTFNIGIAHKILKDYDAAIQAFASIFSSKVDDREPGESIMEEFRNYRYRACLQISLCYSLKGDTTKALEYVRLAREKYTYQAHCGTCASDAEESLKRWTKELVAQENK